MATMICLGEEGLRSLSASSSLYFNINRDSVIDGLQESKRRNVSQRQCCLHFFT